MDVFERDGYTIRRKILKLVGGAFHILDDAGTVLAYSKMKAFKLREDIRLYTDESMTTELLTINARQIVDFAAAYDVRDARSGEKIGALKRKGMRSLLRDHWIIMDANDVEIGEVMEDEMALAVMRRLVGGLGSIIAPQRYHIEMGGRTVATGQQNRNPFLYRVELDFTPDPERTLDRRMGMAIGLLLAAAEGKQN